MLELLKGRKLPVTLVAVVLLISLLAGVVSADSGDNVQVVYWENDVTGLRYLWFFQDNEPYAIEEGEEDSTMGGIGTFGAGEWYIIGAGDLNDDGNADIVWYNAETGLVYYWLMDRLPVLAWLGEDKRGGIGTQPTDWKAVAVADMDNNGNLDIVFQHDEGRLGVWYLDGVEYVDFAVIDGHEDDSMEIAAVADMNGDGYADILWQNDQGDIEIWLMDDDLGHEVFVPADWGLDDPALLPWEIVTVGDFNGDGHNDIVWHNIETGLRLVWYMDGLDFVSSKGIGTVADAAWNLVALATTAGVEKPDIEYASMDGFDPVEVDFGTSEEDAIAELATSTAIYGTLGEEDVAEVHLWRLCDNYSTTTAGTYMATATLTYPENWVGGPAEATTTVTVLPDPAAEIEYASMDPFDPVEVEFGTSEEDAKDALATSTAIYGTLGEEDVAEVHLWRLCDNYSTTTAGVYMATATLTYPENWVGGPAEATTTVTVLKEQLVVVSVEAVNSTTTVSVGKDEAGAVAALELGTEYYAVFSDGSTSTIAIADWEFSGEGEYSSDATSTVNTFEGMAQLEDNWEFDEGVDGKVTGYVVIGITASELVAITKAEFFTETLM